MITEKQVKAMEERFVRSAPRVVYEAIGVSGPAALDGLGKFSIKSITGGLKHAIGVIKAAPKKKLEFLKVAVKDPKKATKMLAAKRVQMHRETVKVGQKVVPVAAAVAAIYFGGPTVVSALKTAGGYASTALKGYSALTTVQKAVMQNKMKKVAEQNPEEAARLRGQPPEVIMASPLVQQAIAEAAAAEVGDEIGGEIASPEAKEMIAAQTQQAAGNMAASAAAPQKPGAGVATAAIGIPLLFALMG